MTMSISSFTRAGRACAGAIAFAALLAAAPALAAGGPSISFGLQLPGGNVHMGVGGPSFHHVHPVCLSDDDIQSELEDTGWRNVQIGDPAGHFAVWAYANWHHDPRLYQMVVDRCSGSVDEVAEVHQHFPHPHPGPGVHIFVPGGPGGGGMSLNLGQ